MRAYAPPPDLLAGRVVLVHADMGSGDAAANAAAEVQPDLSTKIDPLPAQ